MKRCMIPLVWALLAAAADLPAQERSALTLVEVQPLHPQSVTVTGRIRAVASARISPRVSGHIVEIGTDDSGRLLDAGMTVKAGQVLCRLDTTTRRNGVAAAEAALKSAQAVLANLKAPTREERMEQLREAIGELDVRLADRQREEERYRRLVEQEKTLPARRLEEVQTEVSSLKSLKKVAEAKLREAQNGPTKTEIAVADARVTEAEAALKSTQDDLRDSALKAPFAGQITHRFKGVGDYIPNMPPTDIFELVCTDKLEAELRLTEAYYGAVQSGKTKVVLRSPLLKSALTASIDRIVADIDTTKGTFAVRVLIPPDGCGGLANGAFVVAEVGLDGQAHGFIVPLRALVQAGGQAAVFVAENGKMVRRPVELGDRLTEGVVVKSGLAAGQKVVVGPADALQDGAPLPEHLLKTK
jgi:multidrug resistance efflux pump